MLCCQFKLINDIINTLKSHERLQKSSAEFLLKLIESLGQQSLTADEMKLLIRLLQNKTDQDQGAGDIHDNTTEFPYKSHVIHIISSIAKGDGYEHCNNYFDLQEATDGISVASIREWAGPGQGFTFHAWLRLDPGAGVCSLAPVPLLVACGRR